MTGSGHYAIADPRCNACVRLPPVLRKFRSRRFRGDSRPAGAVHRRDGRTAVRRRLQPGSATISIEKIRNRRQTAPSEDGHRTRFGSPDRFRGLVLTISGICRTVGNAGRGVRGRQPVPGEPGDTIRFYIRTPGGGAWRRSRRRTVPGMARSLGALFAGKSTEFLRKVEVTRKPVERNGSQEKAERNRAGQVRSRKFNHAETRCSWRFRYGMRVRGSDIQSISYWAVKLQEVSRQKPVRPFRSRGFGGVIRQTGNAVGRSCLVAPLLFLDRSQTLRRSRDRSLPSSAGVR